MYLYICIQVYITVYVAQFYLKKKILISSMLYVPCV